MSAETWNEQGSVWHFFQDIRRVCEADYIAEIRRAGFLFRPLAKGCDELEN